MNAPVAIPAPGHNNPPKPTPYEAAEKLVTDLYGEARLWLDGAVVDNADLADGIKNLKDELAKAGKVAENARKVEKKPFDDGAKEVQERYKPLLERIEQAVKACNNALTPWLQKLAREQEEKIRAARAEAEEKARIAAEAMRAAEATNLAAREQAEALAQAAKDAEKLASKAEKQTANVAGHSGRATGLRTFYRAEMTDEIAALRHYWTHNRAEIVDLLVGIANRQASATCKEIPGFNIIEEKRAV